MVVSPVKCSVKQTIVEAYNSPEASSCSQTKLRRASNLSLKQHRLFPTTLKTTSSCSADIVPHEATANTVGNPSERFPARKVTKSTYHWIKWLTITIINRKKRKFTNSKAFLHNNGLLQNINKKSKVIGSVRIRVITVITGKRRRLQTLFYRLPRSKIYENRKPLSLIKPQYRRLQ